MPLPLTDDNRDRALIPRRQARNCWDQARICNTHLHGGRKRNRGRHAPQTMLQKRSPLVGAARAHSLQSPDSSARRRTITMLCDPAGLPLQLKVSRAKTSCVRQCGRWLPGERDQEFPRRALRPGAARCWASWFLDESKYPLGLKYF